MSENLLEQLLKPPVGRAAYSDRTAWLMAEMSKLAYTKFEASGDRLENIVEKLAHESDTQTLKRLLADYVEAAGRRDEAGLAELKQGISDFQFELVETFNSEGSQAFLAKRDSDKVAILAFRAPKRTTGETSRQT